MALMPLRSRPPQLWAAATLRAPPWTWNEKILVLSIPECFDFEHHFNTTMTSFLDLYRLNMQKVFFTCPGISSAPWRSPGKSRCRRRWRPARARHAWKKWKEECSMRRRLCIRFMFWHTIHKCFIYIADTTTMRSKRNTRKGRPWIV